MMARAIKCQFYREMRQVKSPNDIHYTNIVLKYLNLLIRTNKNGKILIKNRKKYKIYEKLF